MTIFKEFRDIFAWTYEKLLGIDPSIVVHEIRTYPDVKLVLYNMEIGKERGSMMMIFPRNLV